MFESVDVFGKIAEEYHCSFESNSSACLARSRVHRFFARHLSPDRGRVLDIGCGTGIDAQFIAGLGCKVHGVDRSVGMIAEATKQLANATVDIRKRVELASVEVTSENLAMLLSSIQSNQVVLSFGVINFIDDLHELFRVIGLNMQDGGVCVVTTLAKSSWWERITKNGQIRTGDQPKNVSIGGTETRAWFWDCDDIVAASSGFFCTVEAVGIGSLYPPPYLDKYVRAFPRVQRTLWKLDRKYENSRFSTKYADHVAIVLERRQNAQQLAPTDAPKARAAKLVRYSYQEEFKEPS